MTAASPVWRGYLADVDSRWNVIAGSVDDRTKEERGVVVSSLDVYYLLAPYRSTTKPLKENKFIIPKSRYDSVDLYISNDWINRPEYNDNPLPYDQKLYDRMRDHGQSFEFTVLHI